MKFVEGSNARGRRRWRRQWSRRMEFRMLSIVGYMLEGFQSVIS